MDFVGADPNVVNVWKVGVKLKINIVTCSPYGFCGADPNVLNVWKVGVKLKINIVTCSPYGFCGSRSQCSQCLEGRR